MKQVIRNKTSSTIWRTEKKKSSPTLTFYTLGNETCSLAEINKLEWQRQIQKLLKLRKILASKFGILEFCCPKTSAVVKGIGYNPSEKKLKISSERIKQFRNSSGLMKEKFQLPQEIHV